MVVHEGDHGRGDYLLSEGKRGTGRLASMGKGRVVGAGMWYVLVFLLLSQSPSFRQVIIIILIMHWLHLIVLAPITLL